MKLRILLTTLVLAAAFVMMAGTGVVLAKEGAANSLAVCGCGKVFTPDAKTEYIEANGKSYACCTHECHEMAAKDPAGSAKMAEAAYADALAKLAHTHIEVANVMSVTESGTKAVCGCGKEFTITDKTEYIQANGESAACCTHQCHEMAAKDPEAALKMAKEQLSKK